MNNELSFDITEYNILDFINTFKYFNFYTTYFDNNKYQNQQI